MRVLGVVFTPAIASKGIAMACKRNTLTLGLKRHFSSQLHACHYFSDDFHHDEDELDEAAEGYHFLTVFGSTLPVPSPCRANG